MKIPYALTAATKVPIRHAQMAHAIGLGLPRLREVPIDESRVLSISAYGPSLADTWQDLTPPILSMSGATRFLADRGVIADYHVDMDPRPHKVKHLEPPIDGVQYLMASVCPLQTWDILKNHPVTLWHVFSGKDESGMDTYEWVAQHDHGELVIHGGSTVGLTAIHIGGVLGFRHFEIHGMDGSFADDQRSARHAGPHFGTVQQDGTTWAAEGITYQTSRIMANAVAETINTLKNFPIFCVFHGSGLTQALIREANLPNACTADQTEKASRVRRSCARFLPMPPASPKNGASFWDALLAQPFCPDALSTVLRIAREAEPRRDMAQYNTGTVPAETALLLRALSLWFTPKVAVEIGTFIGTSTLAIEAQHVYTCDRDNDCLSSSERVTCHPYTTSTAMLERLVDRGVSVDLFFFDGRIQQADLPLIQQLSHPRTVYAFDDCVRQEKGVANTALLMPLLQGYALVPPYQAFEGRTTMAALMPLVT